MAVKPIPEGYTSVTPYLVIKGASDAIDYYRTAFGATEIKPVEDQFYGDRTGMIKDPFGHMWNIATHVEDLTMEELMKRSQKAMEGMGGC